MNFSRDTLFGQFYQVAERFLASLIDTMQWLFFEPFTVVQNWYWMVYDAVSGTWYEDFFRPVYRYLAWAMGAPNVVGDEISFGVFILTAGVSIWIFIKVIVFIFDIIFKILDIFADLVPFT